MPQFVIPCTFFHFVNIPQDFLDFFDDGVAVGKSPDPRFYKKPQEWEIASVYQALKSIEAAEQISFADKKKLILDALILRKNKCGGFWYHNQFAESIKETHVRYTAAAIRTLVDGYKDGLFSDYNDILELLKKHLELNEKLDNDSIWFLHDSHELSGNQSMFYIRKSGNLNNLFGSSKQNQFILNTHLDTLLTVCFVKYHLGEVLTEKEHEYLYDQINRGLNAVALFYEDESNAFIKKIYFFLDRIGRKYHFKNYNALEYRFRFKTPEKKENRLLKLFSKLKPLNFYLSYLRNFLRSKSGLLIHPDGFTDRDLSIPGRPAYYHLSNIWDLAKLLGYLRSIEFHWKYEQRSLDLIRKGIEYAFNSTYKDFLVDSFKHYGIGLMVLESIILYIRLTNDLDEKMVGYYVYIRKNLPPSPAVYGYDSTIYPDRNEKFQKYLAALNQYRDKIDLFEISKDKIVVINYSDLNFTFNINQSPIADPVKPYSAVII